MSASRGPVGARRRLFTESQGWIRTLFAVVIRPHLWLVAVRQAARFARPRWWRHAPFLPLPDKGYLRFRLETAYGKRVAPGPADLVSYLEWCRSQPA